MIGIHPHGIWSTAAFSHFVCDNNALPGLDYRVATVATNFRIPFWRDVLMALGFVSADEAGLSHLLTNGTSVCVVVGGAREALDARPGTNDLTLGSRFGFVRLAMQVCYCVRLISIYCVDSSLPFAKSP